MRQYFRKCCALVMMNKEFFKFLLIGVLSAVVDYCCYFFSLNIANLGIKSSKALGFFGGAFFGYLYNRKWTFNQRPNVPGSFWRFAILYLGTLGVNILANDVGLNIFETMYYQIQISFFLATTLSAIINFLGLKFFCF